MSQLEPMYAYIESNVWLSILVLLGAFVILAKCADAFVDSSVSLARKLNVPKLVVGIVLVSLATTAPELSVSLMSALQGKPEMALGNAIGSVICDDGLALALAGVFSVAPIAVMPRILKTSGVFLLMIQLLTFAFVFPNFTLDRWEGGILVTLFVGYVVMLYLQHKRGHFKEDLELEEVSDIMDSSIPKIGIVFALSLLGIIISSRFIIVSATGIALALNVPETIIALTMVALGTSIPEVATCIVAARKNEGAIAVGNIIGADIMNICWVAGASALANPLTLTPTGTYFMFPAMFVIVGAMLIMLRMGYRLTKAKGLVLFSLYVIYLYLVFFVMDFRPVHV